MKQFLQGVINKGLNKRLKVLYGNNVNVVVEDVYWSRRNKNYSISLTVYTDVINESVEVHPDGIEYIVGLALKMMNKKGPIRLTSSLKYSKDGTSNTTL
jgi:hypothetical protein